MADLTILKAKDLWKEAMQRWKKYKLNTCLHETTKATPYQLCFGQPPHSSPFPDSATTGSVMEEAVSDILAADTCEVEEVGDISETDDVEEEVTDISGEVQVCIHRNNFKSCKPPTKQTKIQEMMGGFRLQMAHELSCGVLYALQSDDDTAKHGQSDCDDVEIDQTDQLGDDGDMDDEDDADESDEERTADPNFLVPTYENEPDPNDIFGLKWADANWPLQHCYDMVLEIFHYLMETESDVKLTASDCTSRINKIIVWPEIITALIAIKFNVSRPPPLQRPSLQRPPLQRPPPHQLQPSLDTIITTMGTNSTLLNRVLTEQENIKATLNDLVQSSFCIEKSGFKDDLLVESGLLFCKVMDRLLDQKEISVLVVKVLKSESQKKYKKSTAVRFVKERLSELRAEERRRILGLRPCKDFAVLRCDEFVDKFLPFLKVEKEAIPNYKLHVAVLCKYCRSVLTSQTNTYKWFQTWLKMHFHEGILSSVEMQTMLAEEDSILYPQLQPARSPPPMLSPQQPIEPVYEDYL
eukprot:Em0027g15a